VCVYTYRYDVRGRAKGRGDTRSLLSVFLYYTEIQGASSVCSPPHFPPPFFIHFSFPPADVRGRAEGRSDTRRQLAVAPRLGAWAWAGVHIYFFFIVVCITAFSLCVFERERERVSE